MTDPSPDEIAALKQAVEGLHNCRATYVESVPVHEVFNGQTVWAGDVAIFALQGSHAPHAYAWSHETEGAKRRFVAVLHAPPVDSAVAAVRASIVAESRRN